MPDTLVPDVLAALVIQLRSSVAALSPAIPASAVSDGPFTGSDVPLEYVTVGWTTVGAADITGLSSGVSNDDRAEEFDVHCQLSTASGDTDLTARTTRAGAIYSAIGQGLRANRQLGGLLANGGYADLVGGYAWDREIEATGANVTVSFAIHVSVGWLA